MIKYILISSLSFLITETAFSKENLSYNCTKLPKDTSRFQEIYKNTLKEMDPSLTGKTPQGNKYNLYAIKRGKQWTYLILDSTGYYSVKQDNKKSVEMTENTQSHTDMLCMLAQAKLLKKVAKPKTVSELTFICYYQFKPSAKKMYKSYNKIQRQAKFFEKNLQGGSKGINTILKRELK